MQSTNDTSKLGNGNFRFWNLPARLWASALEQFRRKPTLMQLAETPAQPSVEAPSGPLNKRIGQNVPYNIFANTIIQNVLNNPSPVIQLAGSRGIAVFQEMQLHPRINADWNTRQNQLLNLEWEIIDASEDPEDVQMGAFIRDAYDRINENTWDGNEFIAGGGVGVRSMNKAYMDGEAKGFSGVQVVWNTSEGRIVQTQHHIPQAFDWRRDNDSGSWTPWSNWTGRNLYFTEDGRHAVSAPARKFIMAVNGGNYGNPWGESIFESIYYVWMLGYVEIFGKSWPNFLDRFGQPTTVITVPLHIWQGSQYTALLEKLLTAGSNLQQEYVTILPQFPGEAGDTIKLLESQRQSTISVFGDYIDRCDKYVTTVILGQTATTNEAQYGTYGGKKVVSEVTGNAYIGADADWIASIHNSQPIPWMCQMKFGAPKLRQRIDMNTGLTSLILPKYPKFRFRTEPPEDMNQKIDYLNKAADRVQIGDQYYRTQLNLPPFDPATETAVKAGQPQSIVPPTGFALSEAYRPRRSELEMLEKKWGK